MVRPDIPFATSRAARTIDHRDPYPICGILPDLGTTADLAIMFAALNDRPVSVVATMFSTEKDHGTVARRDRGIVAPAGLQGKRISVTLSTAGHFTLAAFLVRQKLSSGDVKILDFKPAAPSAALLRGDVDAVATGEPIVGTSLAQLGGNGKLF